MTSKEIKNILINDFDDNTDFFDQYEYIEYLKSKINIDWNQQDEITVYEIAFVKYFNLVPYSDILSKQKIDLTYCNKLGSITNSDRIQGIKNAENIISKISGRPKEQAIDEAIEILKNFQNAAPSKNQIAKVNNIINEISTEPKKTIDYKLQLENTLSGFLEQSLCNTEKETKILDGRIVTNEIKILNDVGEELKYKLLRPSAITHILEVYDLIHYLDFNFWIPYLNEQMKIFRIKDNNHHSRFANEQKRKLLKKYPTLNEEDIETKGICLDVSEVKLKYLVLMPYVYCLKYFEYEGIFINNLTNRAITINMPLTKEQRIFEPIRREIIKKLLNGGTKQKNAVEVSGIIISAYKKLIKS